MLPNAYLTNRQLEIWSLRHKGLKKAEIGRILNITRQAVYDAEGITLKKVALALEHAARSNMVEPIHIDSIKGILLGYSPHTEQNVIITFSESNGIQTWHHQQPNCNKCSLESKCRKRLISEAEERNIELSSEEKRLPPSELATKIFESLIPGDLNEHS